MGDMKCYSNAVLLVVDIFSLAKAETEGRFGIPGHGWLRFCPERGAELQIPPVCQSPRCLNAMSQRLWSSDSTPEWSKTCLVS